ncbi:dihydrodipicolinate synthase family protein [Nitrospirales bacterium NOB]|nr:dihydrodipicolinate synthase family protein [Nitrospirales bacterium NOB]
MMNLEGVLTAMVTPFTQDDTVDYDGFSKNVEYQLSQGVMGILVCGTTGEAAVLTEQEKMALTEQCAQINAGRIALLAGIAGDTTAQSIRLAKNAERCKADALLVTLPTSIKCNWEMMLKHFSSIGDATGLPLVLYNNCYVGNTDITVEQMATLIDTIPNARYIKECSYNSVQRIRDIRRRCGDSVQFVGGWDDHVLESYFVGATAWTSICANTVPKLCIKLHQSAMAQDWDAAWEVYNAILPYIEYLFGDSSTMIGNLKYANELLGLAGGVNRNPRIDLNNDQKARVSRELKVLADHQGRLKAEAVNPR